MYIKMGIQMVFMPVVLVALRNNALVQLLNVMPEKESCVVAFPGGRGGPE
jgi:hypothetical protein